MTGWPKSNAESKHIYCSLISIHYQLNIDPWNDAKLQFASKVSSSEVFNDPHTHLPWHKTV